MQLAAPTPLVHKILRSIPAPLLARLDAWSSQAAKQKMQARRVAAKQPRFDFARAL